jgi:molybdopterin-guanine dinucleotide biosynthesis protein
MTQFAPNVRIVIVGGHTRSIGKTQLVCDVISALPEANWIAGKITQYGHGVCAQNGQDCDCAPDEHVCAISWEHDATTGTDSSRFLAAGAQHSFWLRTKQGFLAEGMPLFREALDEIIRTRRPQGQNGDEATTFTAVPVNVVLESNTLLQFLKPDLFLMVLHPGKADFKDSAQLQLDRASAFVLREPLSAAATGSPSSVSNAGGNAATSWNKIPIQLLQAKPQFLQREHDPLPPSLLEIVRNHVCIHASAPSINM